MERILTYTPNPTLVLDGSLRIVHVSESHLKITKFTLEECVGRDVDEFIETKLPGQDVAAFRESIDQAISTKDVSLVEGIGGANGTYWCVRIIPIFNESSELLYVLLAAQDTTVEHSKQEALNHQLYASETYRILVNTVKDYAIFMLDPEGIVSTWNAGASILKQYTQEEIVGKHFSVFYGEDDRAAQKPEKELEVCLRDGKVEDEGWRYRKDGSRFWANVIISPVYRSDELIGFSKVTRDLTERKAGEARLIAAFEEASKLKSDFLANMSHEIRTPMHGMLSAVSLLNDTGLTPEQKELVTIMEESGSVLLQVINDILDYSKLAAGLFTVNADVMDISEIVSAVVRTVKATLDPAVYLEVKSDRNIPKVGKGDSLRYRQVLQNTISNAIKFTETGYVRVKTLLLKTDQNSYTVMTEIIDSGIGVPAEAVSSLFTPFTQFDNSATKRYKGTGLGLSICHSLVSLMGGSIGYRPNPSGQGSIFWFTIVVEKMDRKSIPPPSLRNSMSELAGLAKGKTVLLAEDNFINQTIMVKTLHKFGFDKIDIACDGAQAVQLVKTKPFAYSLILMDISMPVLDGLDATEAIRKMKIDIPIIAMTANVLKGDEEKYLARGMNDYVAKPVDRRHLLNVLSRWLKHDGDDTRRLAEVLSHIRLQQEAGSEKTTTL